MFRSSKDRLFKKKETVLCKVDNSFSCDLCGQGPWDAELDLEIHRKTEHKWDLLKLLKDENIPMCSVSYLLHFTFDKTVKYECKTCLNSVAAKVPI